MKNHSVHFGESARRAVRDNAARHTEAADVVREAVEAARPWREMTLDQVRDLMFAETLPRAWQVWSDGHCPACGRSVPMYTWVADALETPWKLRCPHCGELFPKNDFHAFYRSGLDARGRFDPARADRALLFHTGHPDPSDPLHGFGVDDGHGFSDDGHTWYFIAAYLIFGQWKQAVLGGARALSDAYFATGDPAYARRAGVLLDRVADLLAGFSFLKQGVMYDVAPYVDGFVSYAVDHCQEMKELTDAYDRAFDGMKDDAEFVAFLARKAAETGSPVPKATFADIQVHIERDLLELGVSDPAKLECNFPREHVAKYRVLTVLDRGDREDERSALLAAILDGCTAVDGTSGEKGLANYAALGTQALCQFLAEESRLEGFLEKALADHPQVRHLFRFYLDALCLGVYLPTVGDSGYFGAPALLRPRDLARRHPGFHEPVFLGGGLTASAWPLLAALHDLTGDADFLRIAWHSAPGGRADLVRALDVRDPDTLWRRIDGFVAREGADFPRRSVDKAAWHLALLRDGHGANERAACLTYDVRGAELHGHNDALNLGLFAKGLNLCPDFGYPPVQFGGWFTPIAQWYERPSAHDTVVVDGKPQVRNTQGRTTLWADAPVFKAIRVDARETAGVERFERTVAMVRVSDDDFYLLDVFRVTGGSDHAFFLRTTFGSLAVEGVHLAAADAYGHGALLRDFRGGTPDGPGWAADWTIEDRYGVRAVPPTDLHLRYTGLSPDLEVLTCGSWVNAAGMDTQEEAWIPTLLLRRRAAAEASAPLASTFVGLIEPYEGARVVRSVRRLAPAPEDGNAEADDAVAVEVLLADGRRDVLVCLPQPEAVLSWERRSADGIVTDAWCGAGGSGRDRPARPKQR